MRVLEPSGFAGLDLSLRSRKSDPLHNTEAIDPYHGVSFLALVDTRCRWELFRLLSSIRGRQAAKAKRELAGTEVSLVVRGAGLKGWLRESMCQAAIRILRATAAELWLPERRLTSR